MPITDSDPRVFFAAERTLLAWVRTALGLIGLGFVVARFGLFLRLLTQQADTAASHHVSPWIGVGLAVLGAIAASSASVQHQRFCRSLAPADCRSATDPVQDSRSAMAWRSRDSCSPRSLPHK